MKCDIKLFESSHWTSGQKLKLIPSISLLFPSHKVGISNSRVVLLCLLTFYFRAHSPKKIRDFWPLLFSTLCVWAPPGNPSRSPRGSWREGHLGHRAWPATSSTRPWINWRQRMDGYGIYLKIYVTILQYNVLCISNNIREIHNFNGTFHFDNYNSHDPTLQQQQDFVVVLISSSFTWIAADPLRRLWVHFTLWIKPTQKEEIVIQKTGSC